MCQWNEISVVFRILLSAFLAGIIGTERRFHGRAAGMRTYILVGVGATMTVMTGLYMVEVLGYTWIDPQRIAAQVISGIGFLGAGMILVRGRFEVVGLTTAAGLWATASMGICIGAGFYVAAIAGFAVILFASVGLNAYERKLANNRAEKYYLYAEIDGLEHLQYIIDEVEARYDVEKLDVTAPRSALPGNVGMEMTLGSKEANDVMDLIHELNGIDHILYALKSL